VLLIFKTIILYNISEDEIVPVVWYIKGKGTYPAGPVRQIWSRSMDKEVLSGACVLPPPNITSGRYRWKQEYVICLDFPSLPSDGD
jgi:hypothetical protein